jgi:antibiotic biosynthesis monooxygenase (ABM) superfamily enzyme
MKRQNDGQEDEMAPPKYKMAPVTWIGAWGLISLILYALGPAMATWPLLARTFVISVLMVVGLTWLVIPALTRVFSRWLFSTPAAPRRQSPAPRYSRPSNSALVDVSAS